jgi:hypothetical protein
MHSARWAIALDFKFVVLGAGQAHEAAGIIHYLRGQLPDGRLRASRRLHRKYIASDCLAPVNPSLRTTPLAPRFFHGFARYGYVPDRNLVLEIRGAETHTPSTYRSLE